MDVIEDLDDPQIPIARACGALGISRTPVREALYRLEREGYLQVQFRSGWSVRELDFRQFDELYDLRIR